MFYNSTTAFCVKVKVQSNGFNKERIQLVLTQNFLKHSGIFETLGLLTGAKFSDSIYHCNK